MQRSLGYLVSSLRLFLYLLFFFVGGFATGYVVRDRRISLSEPVAGFIKSISDEVSNTVEMSASVPKVQFGLFSVMKDMNSVDDVLSYADTLYEYLNNAYPGCVTSDVNFGHHLASSLKFKSGLSSWDCAVKVQGSNTGGGKSSQSVVLASDYSLSDGVVEDIVGVVQQFLGIEVDESKVADCVDRLALGDTSFNIGGVEFRFRPTSNIPSSWSTVDYRSDADCFSVQVAFSNAED